MTGQVCAIDSPHYHEESGSLLREVVAGLGKTPASIPPKFFYDKIGSELFEKICETPEYYLTRTEQHILDLNLDEITRHFKNETIIIEPGCGAAKKVRPLLEALRPRAYFPVDIAERQLQQSSAELQSLYPSISIYPHCGDFNDRFRIPDHLNDASRLFFFPGSTIGNLEPAETERFLENVYQLIAPGGALLIGIDLVKDPAILNAAYNDKAGHTAAFNLNLLARIKRELNARIEVKNFTHFAAYNPDRQRVEMHLFSRCEQSIGIAEQEFVFKRGDTIHTENSYKFDRKQFESLAKKTGFSITGNWSDSEDFFSVYLLQIN